MRTELFRKTTALLALAVGMGGMVAQAENVKLASHWAEAADAALAESNDANVGGACCGSDACGSGGNACCGANGGCCNSGNACCGGACGDGNTCCSGGCCDTCCDACGGCALPAISECCPLLNIIGFGGVDAFRGLPDGTRLGNFGLVTGVNAGAPLPVLSRYGIGGQIGVSYGAYDLQGRDFAEQRTSLQEQVFITSGLFRRADAGVPLNLGVVYDAMVNDNFGSFSTEPYLGQWRGMIGYCLSARNEIGWWGAFADRRDTQAIPGGPGTFRTVTQNNLFWHHNFLSGADSWLWVGIPERNRLKLETDPAVPEGSLYEWNLGGLVNVPLSARTAVYGNFAYFCPSSPAAFEAVIEEAWQVGLGLTFQPWASSRNSTVAGRAWSPLMPVANNGTMAVDTNRWQ